MSINPHPCHSEEYPKGTLLRGAKQRGNPFPARHRRADGTSGTPSPTERFAALRAGRGSEFHPVRDIPKKTTQRVVFLFVITLRFCCSHPRISQGRGSVRGKPLRVSPLAFNHPPAGDRFCAAKSPLQKNTTTLWVVVFFWSGRRGSNSLPRPWQGRALPDELRPQTQDRLYLSSQRLSTPFSQFPQKTSCPPLRAGMPAFIA